MRLFVTPWTKARQVSLSFTISRSLPKFLIIESVMLSSYLILWHPLFLLPSIFPSIRQFSHESFACIRWPKYCSFSISPSSEYSGLIFLKIDWFDLLAVQGTFRSPLQHYSLKVSIVWCSAFFMVQLSQPYVTTGKTIQFSLVAQSCLTLCNPMKCSTPVLPVHHQLPEFTQTHVHQVGDAI